MAKLGKGYYKTPQLTGRSFLLRNAPKITRKRASFFIAKRVKGYYKTRQVLKNAPRVIQNAAGITKHAKGYYETRQVLQNALIIAKRNSTGLNMTYPKSLVLLTLWT